MKKTHNITEVELHLPPALADTLLLWYETNARDLPWRKNKEPYNVWLSEIMLQQTRAEAVKGYYTRFLARFPNVEALAACSDEELMKLWEGLGYYSRAQRLKEAAQAVVTLYGGRFPESPTELLKLPGIGPYTAGAIASICFDTPAPAVDGNVLRVTARFCGLRQSIDEPAVKQRVENALREIYPCKRAGEFTQSLMELGAMVCLPNGRPKCQACPLAASCAALKENAIDKLPARTPKKERRAEARTVFLLREKDRTAVLKRPSGGLLGGLWELPNLASVLDAQQALDWAAQNGVSPLFLLQTVNRTHIFTHVEWHMTCHSIECARADERFTWASAAELSERYALPSAFSKFL